METESFNTKNSSLNQNNKYIEYINKDNNPEKLQNQIFEKIKTDIIVVNDIKNNDIKNSNLFFLNQNNIIKRKDNNINKEDLNPEYNEEKIFKRKINLENEKSEKNENKATNFIRINNNFYNNKPKNLKISEISSNNNRNIYDMNKIGQDSKFKTFISEAKENNESKLYQSINNIFFYDYQQKYIKDQ